MNHVWEKTNVQNFRASRSGTGNKRPRSNRRKNPKARQAFLCLECKLVASIPSGRKAEGWNPPEGKCRAA